MISQELSNYVFISKYARYLPEKKRRETWKESVDRIRNMMLEKYNDCEIDEDINWAYDLMQKKKILGSQRVLQFGGKAVLDKNCRAYNCTASYCDRLRFFQECMYVLLCGVGAGYSIQKHHIDKLPELTPDIGYKEAKERNFKPRKQKIYIIPDSIEGWSDSIGVLLSSYFEDPIFPEYYDCLVEFDYSLIRPKGSYLSSASGKAPGPEPLKLAHQKIKDVLDKCLQNGQTKLRSIDAHDIICHLSDAVLAGGIRRSALLALFSKDDKEMFNAKTGDWFINNKQRARANNSVILLRNETTFEEFQELFKYTKEFGEPGIVWSDNYELLLNPCAEVSLFSYDEQGNSGWEFCNLCTINSGNIVDAQDLYDRSKAAAIIGTLQAGFTDFTYLGPITESIVKKESLLGVSLSGIMEQTDITLDKKILKKAVDIIRNTNDRIAEKIGINSAARLTCIKPDGQSSCLLGTSSGIHPHHSKRYIRRVQNNNNDSVYKFFKENNECITEKSVWSANKNDDNILFPIEVKDGSKTKNQVSAIEMLDTIKLIQENWVSTGKNIDRCVQPWLNHNVSTTIVVKDNKWDDLIKQIYDDRQYFGGLSFLSDKGDKDYQQPPFSSVLTSREIVKEYGEASIWCSGLIELGLQAFDNNLWDACDFVLKCQDEDAINHLGLKNYTNGAIKQMMSDLNIASLKIQFLVKFNKFAKNYFSNDIKRLTYCIKDVYNWKLYNDLLRNFKKMDYSLMVEKEDYTNFEGEAACSGGACSI